MRDLAVILATFFFIYAPPIFANSNEDNTSVALQEKSQAPPRLNTLETIVVTSQKRVQSLQSIPVSVTALNEQTLANLQINDASEVADKVVNLNVTRSIGGLYNYFIRGVGMDDFNLSSVPAVGIYLDDVAIQNPVLANFALLDIQRVEVLKGPQVSLFGKNTTGGAINYVSKSARAGQDLNGKIVLDVGNNNLIRLKASAGHSLSNSLGLRMALNYEQYDGWLRGDEVKNNSNFHNGDRLGFNVKSHYVINDKLSAELAIYGARQQQISEIKSLLVADENTGLITLDNFDLSTVETPLINPRNNINALGGSIKLTSLFSGNELNWIASFEEVDSERMDDWGPQSINGGIYQVITYNTSDTLSWSQEFQLKSTEGAVQWLTGLLYTKDSGDLLQTAYIDPAGPGRPDDAIDDAGIGPLFDRGGWVETDTLNNSVYGQLEWPVSSNTSLTLGGRWTRQDLSPRVNVAGMLMDSPETPFPLGTYGWYSLGNDSFNIFEDYAGFDVIERFVSANGGFPASTDIDQSFNEWGGKLALTHNPQQDLMLYASLSRGFKMGAINSNPTTAAYLALVDNVVAPEILVTAEVGIKSEWLAKSLRINTAAFENRWQDYQFFLVYNPGNPADLFASLVNLPKAETRGIELEFDWLLTSELRLSGGIAWLETEVIDAKLDVINIREDLQAGFQGAVQNGDALPNAPEWAGNITLEKVWQGNWGDSQLTLHYNYIGEHIHALAGNNSEQWQHNFSEEAVGLLHASMTYSSASNPELTWQFWARNLTNEQYCTERATVPGTPTDNVRLCAQGAFREVGISLLWGFE